MPKYLDYIRGGEFLIAPSVNYKYQYVLKCSECYEYYDDVESMFAHCIKHQEKSEEDDDDWILEPVYDGQSEQNEGFRDSVTKHEDIIESTCEDPLIDPHESMENISSVIKDEPRTGPHEMIEFEIDELQHDEEPESESRNLVHNSDMNAMKPSGSTIDKSSLKSKAFVSDFMKIKPYVITLIDIYRKQPKLWNSNINAQERNFLLDQISKELKKRIGEDLTYSQVAAIIAHIRYAYRKKIKHIKSGTQQSNVQTWYFKHLNFLRPYIENSSVSLSANTSQDLEQTEYFIPSVPPEHLIQLLEIYRRHPYLWNTDLAENCCENKRGEAFGKMLNLIETEMSLDVNQDTLKEYLASIHKCVTHTKLYYAMKDKTDNTDSPESYKHMKFLYDHVGPFKCGDCGRKYRTALAFKAHKSEHDGSKAIVCSICNREYKMVNTYIAHARRHMEDLNDVCKECGKRFLNPYDLRIHMRCHTGAKPFCCELCGISFRHIQSFASHKRRHEKNYLHKCSICSKGFYNKAKHDDHMRTHTNIRECVCNICGKAFKTKKTLSQHVVIHNDVRKHACPLCGKTFKLKVGVNQHMRTHGSHIDKTDLVD